MSNAMLRQERYRRDLGSVRLLVKFGQQHQLDITDLLAGSGLKAEQLDDPLVAIDPIQELTVIENLVSQLKHLPALGALVGAEYQVTTYGVWGYAVLSSKNTQEAIVRALKYLPLTYVFCDIRLEIRQGIPWLLFSEPFVPAEIREFIIQRDMAATTVLIMSLLNNPALIDRFCYTEPLSSTDVQQIHSYIKVPVEASAPSNAIVLKTSSLNINLPLGNSLTSASSEQICVQLLEQRRFKPSFAAIARQYLRHSAHQRLLDLPSLAAKMCVSERSLRRYLQAEGTSYNELLMDLKMTMAKGMLQQQQPLVDIAEQLGYSDQSAFSQAYRRWFGVPPSQDR